MRVRTIVCCLATLTIVASTTPAIAGSTTPAQPKAPESILTTKADNSRVRLLRPKSGTIARPAGVAENAKPATVAAAHLAEQAGVLGIDAGDLRAQTPRRVAGNDVVRFQQTVDGVPVFGGQLVTVLDKSGNLELVTGETAAQPDKAFPKVSAATGKQLAATATRAVANRENLAAGAKLTAKPTGRQWYVPELIGAPVPDPGRPGRCRCSTSPVPACVSSSWSTRPPSEPSCSARSGGTP
jgi:bacillolysin